MAAAAAVRHGEAMDDGCVLDDGFLCQLQKSSEHRTSAQDALHKKEARALFSSRSLLLLQRHLSLSSKAGLVTKM